MKNNPSHPEASCSTKRHWRWRSEVAGGPSGVHNEALASATVFLHNGHADPIAALKSEARYSFSEQTTRETAVLLPAVTEQGAKSQQHALLVLFQSDKGLPRDKTHGQPCTVSGKRDQVAAMGGETRSRGVIIPTPRSSFEKSARGLGPTGASSKCQESTSPEIQCITGETLQRPRRSKTTHGRTNCREGSL